MLFLGVFGLVLLFGFVFFFGFFFQIAVKFCVDDSFVVFGWCLFFVVFFWRNSNNEETGFIDLVLAHNRV